MTRRLLAVAVLGLALAAPRPARAETPPVPSPGAQGYALTVTGGVLDADLVGQCPADINGDGVVDTADLGILMASFGTGMAGAGDINGDGIVDTADLGTFIAAFGSVCP